MSSYQVISRWDFIRVVVSLVRCFDSSSYILSQVTSSRGTGFSYLIFDIISKLDGETKSSSGDIPNLFEVFVFDCY